MQVNGVNNTPEIKTYTRLSDNDIARMPSLKINRADFYQGSTPLKTDSKPVKEHSLRNKIFTCLTFGLVGLYLAHRQNLFNPIKREAKKIIKNNALKDSVVNFAKENVNNETFTKVAHNLLGEFANNSKSTALSEGAEKLLADKKQLEKFDKALLKVLNDDTDAVRFKNGFAVNILDKLSSKIEKTLKQMKECGEKYKDKADSIIEGLFTKANNEPSVVENCLASTIKTRSSAFIEKYIKDLTI